LPRAPKVLLLLLLVRLRVLLLLRVLRLLPLLVLLPRQSQRRSEAALALSPPVDRRRRAARMTHAAFRRPR
jgi:hypothetical protein